MFATLTASVAQRAERNHARRAERVERDRLRAELASYRTPAERADLEAMFARHTPEEVAELESMLR